MPSPRNQPCPCGSGRKYKHCCMADDIIQRERDRQLAWQRFLQARENIQAAVPVTPADFAPGKETQ